jgi:hypothetical protein
MARLLVVDHGSLPPPPLGSLGQMGCGGRSAVQGCQGVKGIKDAVLDQAR